MAERPVSPLHPLASDLHERARALRMAASRACMTSADVCAHTTRIAGEALVAATAAADEPGASTTMQRRQQRLARVVGRDPAIDEAKTVLAERYISRADAFAILRHTSQRTTTKLSVVAQNIVRTYRH
jgi:ANTAR domain